MDPWRLQKVNGNRVQAPVSNFLALDNAGARDPSIPNLPLGYTAYGAFAGPSPEIEFRSGNTTAWASRTNTTFTAPAGIVDGDIICIFMTVGDAVAAVSSLPVPTPPTGFEHYNPGAVGPLKLESNGIYAIAHYLYWKRASSESGNYTVTHATANTQGWIGAYRNCLETGTPFGAQSTDNADAATTLGIGLSLVTTASRSRLFFTEIDYTGSGGLTAPDGMTERHDDSVYIADQRIATIQTTGTRRHTCGAGGWSSRMVEMLAATGNRRIEPTSRNFTVTRASTY